MLVFASTPMRMSKPSRRSRSLAGDAIRLGVAVFRDGIHGGLSLSAGHPAGISAGMRLLIGASTTGPSPAGPVGRHAAPRSRPGVARRGPTSDPPTGIGCETRSSATRSSVSVTERTGSQDDEVGILADGQSSPSSSGRRAAPAPVAVTSTNFRSPRRPLDTMASNSSGIRKLQARMPFAISLNVGAARLELAGLVHAIRCVVGGDELGGRRGPGRARGPPGRGSRVPAASTST